MTISHRRPAPFLQSDDVSVYAASGEILPEAVYTLFLLGGRRPDARWLRRFAEANCADIWAVDSGAAACRAADLRPSVILGDRDSATTDDWAWAVDAGAVEHLHNPAKDLTDFQLALDLFSRSVAPERGPWDAVPNPARGHGPLDPFVVRATASSALHGASRGRSSRGQKILLLSGCFGGRLDHLFSILSTFASHFETHGERAPRAMIDEREGLFLLYSGEAFVFDFQAIPKAVSLLPMSARCRGVSIEGVRWPLSNVELERNFPWAISNEIATGEKKSGEVRIRIAEGTLAVYWSNLL